VPKIKSVTEQVELEEQGRRIVLGALNNKALMAQVLESHRLIEAEQAKKPRAKVQTK
jgi:hypothetical protein